MIDSAIQKLKLSLKNGKHICVGLDTDIKKIPNEFQNHLNPIIDFNREIINATKDYAAAYKLNLGFYEKDGKKGFESLEQTLELFPKNILVIGDAKRGDIGNTSQMYAESLYNHFGFDAITLNPYMGYDSIEPFVSYEKKINFFLALTSNEGAKDFEKLKLQNGDFLFQEVIHKANVWNERKNCGIVFGATKIDELKENIKLFNDLFVLLPGVGAQGGSIEDVVNVFNANQNYNFLINVSRAIIYADSTKNFAEAARLKLVKYNDIIQKIIGS